MTTTITPTNTVQGAPRRPMPFGMFSVVDFKNDERWEGASQWVALHCDPAQGRSGPYPLADPVGLPKVLDAGAEAVGKANSFAVYGTFDCTPVGYGPVDGERLALAHLEAREEARVEQAFWTGDLGNTPSLKGATVLHGGTAVGRHDGIGLLEDWISDAYGSLGVIHMSRGMASVFLNFDNDNGLLTTLLGTPVIAGAGYLGTGPSGQNPATDQTWVYATPALFGFRSEVFTSSGIPGDLLDRKKNHLYAIAERSYEVGYDPCGAAAVLIDRTN